MSRYHVGIDGGATRTRAVVVDDRLREIARAEGGASLAEPKAPEAAADVIALVVGDVLEQAGVPTPCHTLWAGIAGAGRETVRTGVRMALERFELARTVEVGTDVEAAFEDAFGDQPGVLIVAGTGSIGWGRSESGVVARVGGWGSLLGDEGSGYAIGLEALRRVTRDIDGRGEPTRLEERVLAHLDLHDPESLVMWAQMATKGEIAALVPIVVEASGEGDAVAGEILVDAVEELEGHVLTLLDNLGPWRKRPTIALTGGLLDPFGPLRRSMETMLRQHHVDLVTRPLFPALGAARLASRLA